MRGARKKAKRLGPPPKHGGRSIINKAALIKDQRRLAIYLEQTYEELVSDLGPREEDLTRAQKILIDRCLAKIGTLRLIEIWIAENGPLQNGELRPILGVHYLSWTNSLRLDLQALGIKVRKKEGFLDLGAYFKAKGSEKGAQEPPQIAQDEAIKTSPGGEEQGPAEKAQEGSIQSEGGDHDEGEGGQT